MSMQSQDNALTKSTSKSRALATGRWWRWTKYELRDGYLRPAPGARLHIYDPWKLWLQTRPVGRRSDQTDHEGGTPYRALLEMLNKLEYQRDADGSPEFKPAQLDGLFGVLTPASEQALLAWCAKYGLLGLLPHRVLQVILPSEAGYQLQYDRIPIGWQTGENGGGNPFRPIQQPRAVTQPLRGVGIAVEPLTTTWERFFPGVPLSERHEFAYPEPLTDAFWKIYAEPLDDFLSGARALAEVLSSVKAQGIPKLRVAQDALRGGWQTVISSLVAAAGLAAPFGKNGRPGLNWIGNSLLASLALMLLEDLSKGRALQCPCGQLFVSHAYQARYCSRRCRWRFEQRRFRKGDQL